MKTKILLIQFTSALTFFTISVRLTYILVVSELKSCCCCWKMTYTSIIRSGITRKKLKLEFSDDKQLFVWLMLNTFFRGDKKDVLNALSHFGYFLRNFCLFLESPPRMDRTHQLLKRVIGLFILKYDFGKLENNSVNIA